MNPFDHAVDVYRLSAGEFVLEIAPARDTISPAAFPGVVIDLSGVWAAAG